METSIVVIKAASQNELEQIYAIRTKVFVEEQHCAPELEYAHEEESTHFLAICNDVSCGAARWRETANGFKLERFAVLADFRGMGVGRELVTAVLNDLPNTTKQIYLNAQLAAIPFYLSFGFVEVGEIFEEAGIMHRQMKLVSANQM